ncbi:Hypothetical protein BROD_0809 [Brucella sp. NF 2653]|nr:predicted protein [Brucella sp. 83/13]EFM63146.1 Hypothetical protein BROD_0809 [Brucella sp. NF 2653]
MTLQQLVMRAAALPFSRAAPVRTESLEPLYLFVFTHYPTQNRFTLLLEML